MDKYLGITPKEEKPKPKIHKIPLKGCNVVYFPKIISKKDSKKYYQELKNISYWKKREIFVAGKKCFQNRLSAYFAKDDKLNYSYSGTENKGVLMENVPAIVKIKKIVEEAIKKELGREYDFNYCLANFYQDGNQNIGMHSDDESDLAEPIIASVSLGVERYFDLVTKDRDKDKQEKQRLVLENGSLTLMMDDTQKKSKHGVPIQKTVSGGRINLTFRVVKCY